MRIVLSTGDISEIGGPSKYVSALKPRFADSGITSVLVPYSSLEVSLPVGIRHFVYFLRVFVALVRADAVLAFDTWSVGLPALCAAKILGKPFLVRVGGDFLWEHYVERTGNLVPLSEIYDTKKSNFNLKERVIYRGTRFLLIHASVSAFNSQWQIDIWRRGYGLALSQAIVIENVFPARKDGIPARKKNFVAAGRSLKLKQIELLQEIFTEIATLYPDVTLDIEPLSPEEHQKRVASCYAVVLSSISDVAPNSVIDAVVYGKPFICTKDSGLTERLLGTGIFIDTKNKEALQKAIVSLLDDSFYKDISARVQNFSFIRTWDDVARDFVTAIQTCAS